jgi:AraC-like DNA-binding protein
VQRDAFRLGGSSSGDFLLQSLHALASRAPGLSLRLSLEELHGLIALCPRLSYPEQLIVRGFVTHQMANLTTSLEHAPELLKRLRDVCAASWGEDDWIRQFAHMVRDIEAATRAQNDVGAGRSNLEVRVSKAVRMIEAEYADASLSLQRVADHVGLSLSYLAHSLKVRTGQGFVAHLRHQRVAVVKHLLETTVMSVKEIAAATGYQTPRHLERDFKRVVGVIPSAIRSAASADQERGTTPAESVADSQDLSHTFGAAGTPR